MSMVEISVDKEKCVACQNCVNICPSHFRMAKNGKAEPVKKRVDDMGCAKKAESECPVQAISIKE